MMCDDGDDGNVCDAGELLRFFETGLCFRDLGNLNLNWNFSCRFFRVEGRGFALRYSTNSGIVIQILHRSSHLRLCSRCSPHRRREGRRLPLPPHRFVRRFLPFPQCPLVLGRRPVIPATGPMRGPAAAAAAIGGLTAVGVAAAVVLLPSVWPRAGIRVPRSGAPHGPKVRLVPAVRLSGNHN